MDKMMKKIIFLFVAFLLLINPVSAINFTIIPDNPVAGEVITIKGTGAALNQVLYPSINFEKTISVSNGKYEFSLYGVRIPPDENNFAVTAENTKNLNVRVKILLWLTKSADASGGKATVSQGNVPSGNYDIRIDGDSADGASSVTLKITASSKIAADSQGNFKYQYSSSGVPPGTFILDIGGNTKTITLSETRVVAPTPTTASSSSVGSGDGGGGISGESYSNIEVKEKFDLSIFKDKVTPIKFTSQSNPINSINITGNVSVGEVNVAVEVLKNKSTLVKEPAPGNVYKNMNIWVGTSGFAVPRNIKEAIIMFRVNNLWITSMDLDKNDVKMVKWDGEKWIELETTQKTTDSIYTYYESKTDTFSSFAIIGLKDAAVPEIKSTTVSIINTTTPAIMSTRFSPKDTPISTPEEMPGFEITLAIIAFMVLMRKKI